MQLNTAEIIERGQMKFEQMSRIVVVIACNSFQMINANDIDYHNKTICSHGTYMSMIIEASVEIWTYLGQSSPQ